MESSFQNKCNICGRVNVTKLIECPICAKPVCGGCFSVVHYQQCCVDCLHIGKTCCNDIDRLILECKKRIEDTINEWRKKVRIYTN